MKTKLSFSPLASDIIISVYILITLIYRFQLENTANISTLNSVFLGLSFIMIIWVLIKLKVLNPNWFGLIQSKNISK
ncbi:MAG: hypothetical protein ABF264_06955 [Flavobacteriales bacterium]